MDVQKVGIDTPIVRSSMWHRPRVYWTIVIIYLLTASGVGVAFVVYTQYGLLHSPLSGSAGDALGLFILYLSYFWIAIFLIPALIGAVKLLRVSRYAESYSLAALVVVTIPLLFILLPLQVFYGISYDSWERLAQIWFLYVALGISFAMFPLLHLGRKTNLEH